MNTQETTESLVAKISEKGRTRTTSGAYYPELSDGQRRMMFKESKLIPRRFLAGLLYDEMISGKLNAADASPKEVRTALVKSIAQCLNRITVTNMVIGFSKWLRCPTEPGAVFGAITNVKKRKAADQSQKASERRKLSAGAQGKDAARKLTGVWSGGQ